MAMEQKNYDKLLLYHSDGDYHSMARTSRAEENHIRQRRMWWLDEQARPFQFFGVRELGGFLFLQFTEIWS